MSAIMTSNAYYAPDGQPASPSSPTMQFASQQPPQNSRSFMNLAHTESRSQAPLPVKYQQYVPSEPPPGMSYAAFLRTWTDESVAKWLNEIKCGCHEETFKANDIRGDVLLELDQITLKEMGISSIGDRLRILNAVKALRQRVANKFVPPTSNHKPSHSIDADPKGVSDKSDGAGNRQGNRRLENVRPKPLQLNGNAGRGDLPVISREQPPDSARSTVTLPIRPLPNPTASTPPSNNQLSTPSSSAHSSGGTPGQRPNLPPLPPPPRGQPPLPPSRTPVRSLPSWSNSNQSDAPAYTSQPTPPTPQSQGLLTPSSSNWVNHHLPSDPRPGNPGSKVTLTRSISPVPPGRPRPNPSSLSHARNSSTGINGGISVTPNKRVNVANSHPYANAQTSAVLHPPSNLATTLSPIDESFSHHNSPGTPSPPTHAYTVGRGPFNPPTSSSSNQYTLDDLRRKTVKFVLPDEGLSFTIDVASCTGGVEVLEKVLKKFGKGSLRSDGNMDVSQTDEGGLMVDGWGVFMDLGQEVGHAQPLTEGELLSICHAPDHPTRENGLVLRRIRRDERSNSPSSAISSTRSTKRASSISVLSGLGVTDPEKALAVEPPSPSSGKFSPSANAKRPSKLRNFFGQRPPSELITTHLTEYFPNTEKRVLRRSLMRRRESVASYNQSLSRFSGSTQGSGRKSFSPRSSISTLPPPVPDKNGAYDRSEDLPRVSLSTDDGRSVDLQMDSIDRTPQHLPPIPFPTESLSESLDNVTNRRAPSRTLSTASKRMSYMTELRSKRDQSDTASLMTVDEITAEVENRRVSKAFEREEELEGWTKVDSELDNMVPKPVVDDDVDVEDDEVDDDEDDDDEDELSDGVDDGTLNDDEELSLDVDDDGVMRNVIHAKKANKWIKGALIGAGSFGKVYLGMDASNGLLMAVKQVELPTGSGPNQERKKSMLSALEREIELLKNLQHENIVQYLYSSIDSEYLNIFLEYVPGGSVTALLRNYGAFEEPLVKNFVRQILQGLNYLHERDIIHRDIKGANILVDNKGGIKISDFGISKKVDDNLLTGNRINRPSLQGSVFWMAPEVVKQTGHTRKADIWSVGCLVVEMLTGEHPWAQLTQMQAIFKIGSLARPTIPSDISAEAQDFLRQTFELNHEARPSAQELLSHPWIVPSSNTKK
ncbi:Protein kinase byr2 [Psilocybe cubensis]|uniref:Protein kinase byr2 n=2 Tax=Psilocybe cubensis TaxID=181762 RepID=A0ACB8H8Q2_PSICU|nr:Protein kinase byr2 [Psilocybe cubensis]KAH9484209.1 Protein kinase byr2 [Psilocybe cubensis]